MKQPSPAMQCYTRSRVSASNDIFLQELTSPRDDVLITDKVSAIVSATVRNGGFIAAI